MKFSEKIYLLRKEAGMTQSELSEALHVSRQSISKWEMGTAMPDMVNIIAISKIFLVSIDYLIHDDIEVRESQKKINLPSHNNKKKKYHSSNSILTDSPKKETSKRKIKKKTIANFLLCDGKLIFFWDSLTSISS